MSARPPLDPYQVLGLPARADKAEVRVAWREAARRCHPDRGGDIEEFRRARRAFDLLNGVDVPGDRRSGPTVVRHLGPTMVARRWWRRRRRRVQRPRVS